MESDAPCSQELPEMPEVLFSGLPIIVHAVANLSSYKDLYKEELLCVYVIRLHKFINKQFDIIKTWIYHMVCGWLFPCCFGKEEVVGLEKFFFCRVTHLEKCQATRLDSRRCSSF